MNFDYSVVLKDESNNYFDSWKNIYDESLSLPHNFLSILHNTIYLPNNHYKIIATYAFIPSVLARVVPYLFLYGVSGSGKSSIGKLIASLHGISLNSSSDTFASIRNSLNERRTGYTIVPSDSPSFPDGCNKEVEINTCMVWDDIDAKVFTTQGDLYRLFKFGYDKSADKIEMSSIDKGKNETFHCFCPKTFSSIVPLHSDDRLLELRRRLLVIPTKKLEDLPQDRIFELDNHPLRNNRELINVDLINWEGFDNEFRSYWNLEKAREYLALRKILSRKLRTFTSNQKIVSLDLLVTGITANIWNSESEAITDIKSYWEWFDKEIQINQEPLTLMLKNLVETEELNALNNGTKINISNAQIRAYCEAWYHNSDLLQKPTAQEIKRIMTELGYRLAIKGQWVKL